MRRGTLPAVLGLIVLGLTTVWFVSNRRLVDLPGAPKQPLPKTAAAALASGPKTAVKPVPATPPAAMATRSDFQIRPLPIARETNRNQWTSGDDRSPAVILELAHNQLGYRRMIDENS